MRIKTFTFALFLIVARQWNGAGKLPMAPELRASTQPIANASESSSLVANPTPTTSAMFTDADFARHVALLKSEIKKKLRAAGTGATAAEFSFVIQRPFVVIGDEPKQLVQERAEGTVKWAVDRLKQDFFANDPKEILDIWLFKDAASYEKHAAVVWRRAVHTLRLLLEHSQSIDHEYRDRRRNVVHEIVHPFMEANFAACPPWLNEGLGSLYEQSGDDAGHIRGFTNWRLPGLQQAIRAKQVPSFKELTAMGFRAFYSADKGTNYAQARYLCYYLQEKGVLVKFYKEFHARQKEDPTGFKSLQKVLAEPDMDAFKTKWEAYVLELRRE